jgi:hypothetical protein
MRGFAMIIKCNNCGESEKTDKDFFVKVIGVTLPVGGFGAWVTYLLAGTGLAFEIVVAMITGGLAMLMFKDEIVGWIVNAGYKCPKCGYCDWTV